jgi:hypothetical protein
MLPGGNYGEGNATRKSLAGKNSQEESSSGKCSQEENPSCEVPLCLSSLYLSLLSFRHFTYYCSAYPGDYSQGHGYALPMGIIARSIQESAADSPAQTFASIRTTSKLSPQADLSLTPPNTTGRGQGETWAGRERSQQNAIQSFSLTTFPNAHSQRCKRFTKTVERHPNLMSRPVVHISKTSLGLTKSLPVYRVARFTRPN